jgi:uncharacterized membrane protein
MKSTIVFFDSSENGKRGTLRGLVIFPIFIILTLLWFLLTKKPLYDKHIDQVDKSRLWVAMGVSALLIVSAVAVHTPDTVKKAVVYSGLVGFVVYGISNAVLLATSKKWGYDIALIDTLWGIVSTALLGYILYEVVKKWPKTFAVV